MDPAPFLEADAADARSFPAGARFFAAGARFFAAGFFTEDDFVTGDCSVGAAALFGAAGRAATSVTARGLRVVLD